MIVLKCIDIRGYHANDVSSIISRYTLYYGRYNILLRLILSVLIWSFITWSVRLFVGTC